MQIIFTIALHRICTFPTRLIYGTDNTVVYRKYCHSQTTILYCKINFAIFLDIIVQYSLQCKSVTWQQQIFTSVGSAPPLPRPVSLALYLSLSVSLCPAVHHSAERSTAHWSISITTIATKRRRAGEVRLGGEGGAHAEGTSNWAPTTPHAASVCIL